MQRVQPIQPEQARGRTKELLETVERAFGMVPNAVKVMANSPAVLDSLLALGTAMGSAKIGDKLHTQIKLGTSEANACPYCTSILCAIGPKAGLTTSDLVEGRSAQAADARTDAALKFAKAVLETKGKVGDDDLRAVRKAGFGDTEIVEIVASVVVGSFTNFLNNVAETALDIPEAGPLVGHAA
jgi:alkylhydroperoxidase family enzyme